MFVGDFVFIHTRDDVFWRNGLPKGMCPGGID
jgi:hypothetical protein